MKNLVVKFALACLVLPTLGNAQSAKLQLPEFGYLSNKAIESVNISVSPWLLRTAAMFIDEGDADGAATKKLLAGIKSVEVRSYRFATDAAYSTADLDAVRRQLEAPGWTRLIQVHGAKNSQDVDMFVLIENNLTQGFVLIASEPREFTIINIVGSISLEDLPKLENQLHLPKLDVGHAKLMM
jgi:hypothetical protein